MLIEAEGSFYYLSLTTQMGSELGNELGTSKRGHSPWIPPLGRPGALDCGCTLRRLTIRDHWGTKGFWWTSLVDREPGCPAPIYGPWGTLLILASSAVLNLTQLWAAGLLVVGSCRETRINSIVATDLPNTLKSDAVLVLYES
jgi:hypothetical protein